MIDLSIIEQYKENNRIEAKKALGGLPHSIWETYSAFANTIGGVILLGVEEYRDKSFHTVDLPDPERLVKEFWEAVNDPDTVSINILSAKDVSVETVNGDHIIVITVPQADRFNKPIYTSGNPLNTYRRNGEGDYRCTAEEYKAMVRDAAARSQDMLVLEDMDTTVFDPESISIYRKRMKAARPAHVWETLEEDEFLLKLGAVGIGKDGKIHPTCAGLLSFANEYDIIRAYPRYFLDYRVQLHDSEEWTDRIISSSGDWSGNVLDFYFRVHSRLQSEPLIENESPAGSAPLITAVCEALANAIVNADYCGGGGIVVLREASRISISNPGSFRIGISTAKSGGLSDPRNSCLQRIFSMINIGKRTGNGIANIYRAWKDLKWQEPEFIRTSQPDRITLLLPLTPAGITKPSAETEKGSAVTMIKRQMIIDYLTERISATASELASWLNMSTSRVRDYLMELIDDGIVIAVREDRKRKYKLKS